MPKPTGSSPKINQAIWRRDDCIVGWLHTEPAKQRQKIPPSTKGLVYSPTEARQIIAMAHRLILESLERAGELKSLKLESSLERERREREGLPPPTWESKYCKNITADRLRRNHCGLPVPFWSNVPSWTTMMTGIYGSFHRSMMGNL
jgi:hypothetical protein